MMAKPAIVTLSGESGCGKTTLCTRVVALARARGLDVAGLLTLPRFAEGHKIGLDVEAVRTGRRRPLADACTQFQPRTAGSTYGPATESWHFHTDGLAWGARALRRATPCDLLVMDELGPLELVRGQGWRIGLDVLRAGGYRLAIVVVRPGLLPDFLEGLGDIQPPLILTVTRTTADALARQIIALLGED